MAQSRERQAQQMLLQLPVGTQIENVLLARSKFELTGTAIGILCFFAVMEVIAIAASGRVLLPGGFLLLFFIRETMPFRWLALTSQGGVVFKASWRNSPATPIAQFSREQFRNASPTSGGIQFNVRDDVLRVSNRELKRLQTARRLA
jgi:hypothetical protein